MLQPQHYLGSEPSRIRGSLADLNRIIDATSEEQFRVRMDFYAGDIAEQLEYAAKRVRRAMTELEAQRAIERGEEAEARASESTSSWGVAA